MMRKVMIAVVIVMIMGMCQFVSAEDSVIYISQTVPYSDANEVAKKIVDNCDLPKAQADFIVNAGKDAGFTIKRDDEAVKAGKGRILKVEISNAISSGNAWTGHRKQVNIRGKLFENGKEIGNFSGLRTSGGGFAGGYKGSCTVLNRCCKSLAKDLAEWLKKPTKDARIGQ